MAEASERARARSSSKPRAITQHLADVATGQPTTRLAGIDNPGPETNAPEGAVIVESTRLTPGEDGPAVVAVPSEIAGHVDDDAHLDAGGELVEPPVLEREGEGITSDEPPAGKHSTDDPRTSGGEESPAGTGGETLTTDHVEQPHKAAPRKGTPGK